MAELDLVIRMEVLEKKIIFIAEEWQNALPCIFEEIKKLNEELVKLKYKLEKEIKDEIH